MNKTAICTISTQSHIFKSQVTLQSAREHTSADLFCLVVDGEHLPQAIVGERYHQLDILEGELANKIIRKYTGNKLRWSCKPLYLTYLLNQGYDSVIYVDNDICFFSRADFLFEALEKYAILLTPHHYSISPHKDTNWLEANFRVGLYNAGFLGVSTKGLTALQWWAECCLYTVKKSSWRGLFDDQKYLDLLPVAFEDVHILSHRGCNVAGWNLDECERTLSLDGSLSINQRWPLVFVHFAPLTFENILKGKDPLLEKYFNAYIHNLREINPTYSVESDIKKGLKDYLLYFRHIRWKFIRFFE